ncbi:MAG: InlB B-repeat-containing protein [Clostridia bacterium]|nr:InlB B-repeat-containing protein [Clostridia bacterium]MBP3582607.1 InlB B-repeat-containing protein [Clostridia bacterium]
MKKRTVFLAMVLLSLLALLFSCEKKQEYTITFKVLDDTYKTETLPMDTLPAVVKNPTVKGYAFYGWYYDKDEWNRPFILSEFSPERDTVDGSLTVYAKLIPTYTVEFISVDTVHTSQSLTYDKLPTLPTAPERGGHRFAGWYYDKDTWQKKFDINSFDPTADAADGSFKLYARYISVYTVFYYIDNQYAYKEILDFNEKPNAPTAPKKEGHVFDGWYFDNLLWERRFDTESFVPESIGAGGELALYARYTEKTEEQPGDDGTLGGGGNSDDNGWTGIRK